MRRTVLQVVMTLTTALMVSGCAARMSASSHVERARDFSVYRTYQWGSPDALPTGDPRLDNDPFFRDHMMGAIEKQLAARGLQFAESGSAELLIHYHANVVERIDVNGIDSANGYCGPGDCPASVVRYEAGTIVLDVIDAASNRLIWRGWVQTNMRGVIGNRAGLSEVVDEAAARILQRFPRSPRAGDEPPAK